MPRKLKQQHHIINNLHTGVVQQLE